jgi:hypothetical protein
MSIVEYILYINKNWTYRTRFAKEPKKEGD